jgi:hypothetical protein
MKALLRALRFVYFPGKRIDIQMSQLLASNLIISKAPHFIMQPDFCIHIFDMRMLNGYSLGDFKSLNDGEKTRLLRR